MFVLCYFQKRLPKLGMSKFTQVDFLPRELVSYSKETQTPLATHQSTGKLFLFTFLVIFVEIARDLHPSCCITSYHKMSSQDTNVMIYQELNLLWPWFWKHW